MESFANKAIELLTQAGGKIIVALIVFIVGRLIIKALMKFFGKAKAGYRFVLRMRMAG